MLEVQFSLTHDAGGKKLKEDYGDIWEYPILEHDHPFVKARFKEFIAAVGLKPKGALDTDKIVGTVLQLKLKSDTNEDGDYRPRVGKMMALADAEEPESEDDDDDATNTYSAEELGELAKKDLLEVAEENGVDVPAKITAATKKKLIAAIVAAQEEEDEDEDEDEDDDEDGVDLDELDRAGLKAFIKDEELEISVKKKMSDDEIRAAIVAAMEDEDEDEDDDEDEDEDEDKDDYTSWSVGDLKKELGERELATSGSKTVLAARLKKDDEAEPF